MMREGFNPASFLSWAKRRGILNTDRDYNTKKKLIGKMHPRCVCIKDSTDICAYYTELID